jgi:hypothetical protein
LKSTLLIILSIVFILCLASCNEPAVEKKGLWENATYTKDTTVGKGAKEVKIDIVADDQTITLTVKTDKATLGEALYEQGLINDPSFFDVLNGMKADWNKDQAYWCFYEGEEMMMVGVNATEISGGEHYRFVYTK